MMLVFLAVCNLTMMAYFIRVSIKSQDLDFFFWSSLILVFALPSIYDGFQGGNDSVLEEAFLFVFGFNVLFWLGKKTIAQRYFISPNNSFIKVPKKVWFLLIVTQFSALILLFVNTYMEFGIPFSQINKIFIVSWREVSFEKGTIYRSIAFRLMFVGSGACILAWVQKRWGIFFLSIFWAILMTSLAGIRVFLAPAFAPLIFYFVIKNSNFRDQIFAAFLGVVLLFLVYQVQTLRYTNNRSFMRLFDSQITKRTVARIFDKSDNYSGELYLRKIFYFFVKNMPQPFPFGNGQTYVRLAMLPFPTSIMGGIKPKDITKDLAVYRFPERAGYGGTVHPLIYGESYANFGFWGIFLGFFWGFFFSFLKILLNRLENWYKIIMLAPVSAFAIFLARGAVYSSVVYLVHGSILMFLVLMPLVWQKGFQSKRKAGRKPQGLNNGRLKRLHHIILQPTKPMTSDFPVGFQLRSGDGDK